MAQAGDTNIRPESQRNPDLKVEGLGKPEIIQFSLLNIEGKIFFSLVAHMLSGFL